MIAVDVSLTRGDFSLRAAFETKARILALYGPSGAGKTTLALVIAGLLRPDRGFVRLGEDPLTDTDRRIFVPERAASGSCFRTRCCFHI